MSRKTRKLIWSAPLVAVLAVAGVLALFVALEPGSVFANPLPAAPSNLEAEAASGDAGRTTLVLDWDAPAGGNVSGYRIDMSNFGGVWETLVMDTASTATTYTDMDSTLTASDTRWYRVFAVNSHGVGPVSNAVSGTTDERVNPGSVRNLRAVPNTKNPRKRLDLSWDAPAKDGGEMIVGYEIQAHLDGEWRPIGNETDMNEVTVVTKTSYPDPTNMDPGDSQLYRARAVNGTEELEVTAADTGTSASEDDDASEKWVQVTGKTQEPAAPGQITGLTAVNTGETEISLYWYDPEDTGGWRISGYVIQAHRQGKKFQAFPTDAQLAITTATAPTLTANVATGVDNANWIMPAPAADAVVAPENPHQARFTGIVGRIDPDDADNIAVQQRWYFRVYAITTDHGPDNDLDEADDNVIRRSRSASNTASDTAGGRATFDHDGDEGNAPLVDPLAPPGIDATSQGNNPSDAKEQRIDLDLTLNGTLVVEGVVVKEQIAYRIDYSKDGVRGWKLLERSTRFTDFSEERDYADDNGLGYDEERSYRVFAIGGRSTDVGPSSDIASGDTAMSTAPEAPTGVTASSPSLRSIQASWTAPKDNGGKPIVKYLAQWVLDDEDNVAEHADFTNTDTDASASLADDTTDDAMTTGTFKLDSDLMDDTVYVFRVAAVNKDGDMDRPATDPVLTETGAPDWSDPVLFNTTEAAKPNAVEGLTAEAASDTSGLVTGVNLLWNKPSGDIDIMDYDIEVQDEEGDWANPENGEGVTKNRTWYTDPDEPEADEVRKYQVRASNGAGEGPWTMVYYPRDPAADHAHGTTGPTNVMASSDAAGELMLTWEGGANADSYLLIAVNMADTSDYETMIVGDGAAQMGTVTGLTSGVNYLGIVVALQGTGANQTFSYGASGVQAVQ